MEKVARPAAQRPGLRAGVESLAVLVVKFSKPCQTLVNLSNLVLILEGLFSAEKGERRTFSAIQKPIFASKF